MIKIKDQYYLEEKQNIFAISAIRLKRKDYEIILVIPPMRSKTPLFDKQLYDDLYEYVSGFSLMTYDFSSLHRPGRIIIIYYKYLIIHYLYKNILGPNAPIKWIEDCVKLVAPDSKKRDKLFTGMNFYGYEYTPSGGGAIINNDYIKLLKSYKGKLDKDEKSEEHYFELK